MAKDAVGKETPQRREKAPRKRTSLDWKHQLQPHVAKQRTLGAGAPVLVALVSIQWRNDQNRPIMFIDSQPCQGVQRSRLA
jgi:hypothetical protein